MPSAGYHKRRVKWSRAEILAAAQEWERKHGEPPRVCDWNPSIHRRDARVLLARAHRWLVCASRVDDGVYPWPSTVQVVFGSWNAMIRAAGFAPYPRVERLPACDPSTAVTDISALVARAKNTRDPDVLRRTLYLIADKAIMGAGGVKSR